MRGGLGWGGAVGDAAAAAYLREMQEVLASNADVLLESGMPSSELVMLIL